MTRTQALVLAHSESCVKPCYVNVFRYKTHLEQYGISYANRILDKSEIIQIYRAGVSFR